MVAVVPTAQSPATGSIWGQLFPSTRDPVSPRGSGLGVPGGSAGWATLKAPFVQGPAWGQLLPAARPWFGLRASRQHVLGTAGPPHTPTACPAEHQPPSSICSVGQAPLEGQGGGGWSRRAEGAQVPVLGAQDPTGELTPPASPCPLPLQPWEPCAQPLPLALGSHPRQGSLPSCFGAPILPAGPLLGSPALCSALAQVYAPSRPGRWTAPGGRNPAAQLWTLAPGPGCEAGQVLKTVPSPPKELPWVSRSFPAGLVT